MADRAAEPSDRRRGRRSVAGRGRSRGCDRLAADLPDRTDRPGQRVRRGTGAVAGPERLRRPHRHGEARRTRSRRRRRGAGGHGPDRSAGDHAAQGGDGRTGVSSGGPGQCGVHLLRREDRADRRGRRSECAAAPVRVGRQPVPAGRGTRARRDLVHERLGAVADRGADGRADGVLVGDPVRHRAGLPAVAVVAAPGRRRATADVLRRRHDTATAHLVGRDDQRHRGRRRRTGHCGHRPERGRGGGRLGGSRGHHRRRGIGERRRGARGRPGTSVTAVTAASATAAEPAVESPATSAVWCSGLRKRYRRRVAVDDVSFSVGRGEVLGLLGPNGAGKTTVIKSLLGLVRPDAGEILLLGRPAAEPPARARVGYLPELFRYQPWLTAAEVVALHVRLAGIGVPVGEQHECLGRVGLGDRRQDRVGGFSKGMQQRLGLALALVARPELVVLDEPTSALDPIGRADVRDIVLELKARQVAVLLNSHLIGEVERVCDRVVILDHGKVAAAGTLADLLGQRELRLRLADVDEAAYARLAETGRVVRSGDAYAVELPGDADVSAVVPDLVAALVGFGVRVHAVDLGRISLEQRLLDILRTGNGEEPR
ncbi:MAG: ABC transporter ATP-binding protein [Hamadaea sp.]|nr:ABC transporter ATP-binding protein [Hamadaea sp.]